MKHTAPSLIVLARSAIAFVYEPGSAVGPGPQAFFAEANRTPNITKSIDFAPFGNNDGDPSRGTWSWTVNITEVIVTDSVSPPGLSPAVYTEPDAKVLNTVYSFRWDQDSNDAEDDLILSAELNKQQVDDDARPVCVSPISANVYLPPNVTNLFTEDTSGLCSVALGNECVDAIRDAYLAIPASNVTGCRGQSLNMTDIPACQGNGPNEWYALSSKSSNAQTEGSYQQC